jgi:hypothetical protein
MPKSLTNRTESMTCSRSPASKSSGTPSLDMKSSKWIKKTCGSMFTYTTWLEGAKYERPGVTGFASTPPWPKNHGFSMTTASCPASGVAVVQAVRNASATKIHRSFLMFPP